MQSPQTFAVGTQVCQEKWTWKYTFVKNESEHENTCLSKRKWTWKDMFYITKVNMKIHVFQNESEYYWKIKKTFPH